MAKPPGLVFRDHHWRIRIRVPGELVSILHKREVGGSLKTTDLKEAIRRFHLEHLKYDQMFEDARRRVQPVARRNLVPEPILAAPDALTDDEAKRLAIVWFHELEKKGAAKDRELLAHSESYELEGLVDSLHMDETALLVELGGNIPEDGQSYDLAKCETEKLLKEHGFAADWNSEPVKLLHRTLARGYIEYLRRSCQRLNGNVLPERAEPLFLNVGEDDLPAITKVGPPKPKLSKILENYVAQRRPSISTGRLYTRCARWLIEVCGDRPIDRYLREDVIRFRSVLERTPSRSEHMRVSAIKDTAASIPNVAALTIRSEKSIINILSATSTIFRYAQEEGLISMNPVEHTIPKSKGVPAKRMKFSSDDLRSIFTAPLYSGCVDDKRGYAKSGKNKPRNARFWIPLIALYSGMRLNEICQLYVTDIEKIDGIDCIRVRLEDETGTKTGDKSLKTKNAHRTVPVHPELVRIGFLDFVAECRVKGDKRLFEEIPLTSNRTYSDSFQKWFRRFLESVGIEGKKSFHSFRHGFRDALRVTNTSLERVNALCGWEESSGLAAHYGEGYPVNVLYEEICKVSFPDLDLSPLYSENASRS